METSEKRRRKLLEQTRALYSDKVLTGKPSPH